MQRSLWMVLADTHPAGIVAAHSDEEAWAIVAALDDEGDLPTNRIQTELVPCPVEQSEEVWTMARSLGCANHFLACLRGGWFMTELGTLHRHYGAAAA